MSENSSSAAVGRTSIDTYLESVERALLAANAPYGDRLQVLQDLESQIADMLAQQPPPLTEEVVRGVIAMLELPRHFAETYGAQGKEMRSPLPDRPAWLPYNRWVVISAMSCALIPLSCIFLMFAAANSVRGPGLGMMAILLIAGCMLTPFALWKGYGQLRAEPRRYLGREVALGTMIVYFSTVPLLLFVGACLATQGYIMFPIGAAAFVYLQYLLVRRVWRSMTDALPSQTTGGSLRNSSERDEPSPVSFVAGLSMAAL